MPILQVDDFSGGLNDTAASNTLPSNYSQNCRNFNFIFQANGKASLQKISGSAKINSAAFNSGATFTALTEFRLASTKFLVGICGDKIAKMDDTDGTLDDISAALTITPGSPVNNFTHTEAQGLKIFSNGVDVAIKWDGTGNAEVLAGTPPISRSVLFVNGHLCFARDTTNTRRVQFSDLDNVESYTSTHFFDLGTEPTAQGSIANNLYVFELYKVTRYPIVVWPFSHDEVITGVGCVGPRALVNIDGVAIMFMSVSGKIYVYDGETLRDVSSGLIETEIKGMNKARIQHTVFEHHDKERQILISYSAGSSSTHNKVLMYDYTKGLFDGAWMPWTDINANVLASIVDQRSSGEGNKILLTGDDAGFARQLDTGTSNDESTNNIIDTLWESGWFALESVIVAKNTRFAHISANDDGASNLDFKLGFDGESGFSLSRTFQLTTGAAQFGSAIFGVAKFAGGAFRPFFLDVPGIGKLVKFAFQSSRANEIVSLIRSLDLEYEVLGRRESAIL